jgi:hypothetical protein
MNDFLSSVTPELDTQEDRRVVSEALSIANIDEKEVDIELSDKS